MTVKEKIEKIKELQEIKTPWEVMRFLGNLEIDGEQISFQETGSRDYLSLKEAQNALTWLVEQLGGKVSWKEARK